MSILPIRVLIIAGQLGLGGAERQLYYLLSAMSRERFKVRVLNLSGSGGFYWQQRLEAEGIAVVAMSTENRLRRAWRIRRDARRWRADVIHSFHFHVNGYGVLASWPWPRPVIGGMRSLPSKEVLGRVPRTWGRLCLYGVDRLVCNSHAAGQLLRQTHPALTNLEVVPNGVAIPKERELAELRHRGCTELGKKEGQLTVGFVGSLREVKNVSLLLRAAAQLKADFPQLRLAIVGAGPLRSELEAEARQPGLQGIATFLGQRPLAEELMPAFDLLCLPSGHEGMPNVLMEAGAVGVPVVATAVGGVPEVVVDGETGLLFPPGDVDSLAHNLRRLLEDRGLRTRMGRAARSHVQRCFSIQSMVERYERLYLALTRARERKALPVRDS